MHFKLNKVCIRQGSVLATVALTFSSKIACYQTDSIYALFSQKLASDNTLGINVSSLYINSEL